MGNFDRKAYLRDYQRDWVKRRRESWVAANGPCAKCGSGEALEVDHVDPSTKLCNPGAIWSRRAEFRELELAKCQVLCKRCHKVKTKALQQAMAKPCGTWQAYTRGCHCRPCTDAEAMYARERRARKRAAAG